MTVPADITAEATGPDGAVVTFTATAADLVDGAVARRPASRPPEHSSPLGARDVTCTATDAAGNDGTGASTSPSRTPPRPVVTVPADMTVEATGPDGAAVTFSATATDNVDGDAHPSLHPGLRQHLRPGPDRRHLHRHRRGAEHRATAASRSPSSTPPRPSSPSPPTSPSRPPAPRRRRHLHRHRLRPRRRRRGRHLRPGLRQHLRPRPPTVTCTATDAAGNTAAQGFTSPSQDTTAPDRHRARPT